MNQTKKLYGVIEGTILAVVALLAFTVLKDEYLFGWVTYHWRFYLVLCFVALLLLFFNKRVVSAAMTGGIAIGIFVGNYLGDMLKLLNEGKIVEGMEGEEIWRLRHHPGFEIWIGIILIAIVIGAIVPIVLSKKANKRAC